MNRVLILLAATFAIAAPALAHDYMQGDIHIMKPWSRPLAPVSANGAAYMTLVNKGSAADKLVAVSTPMAMKAELHTHTMEGGMMKMRRVDAIEIAPGTPSVLKPGGLHVMMMGLKEPLVEGKSYPLTLTSASSCGDLSCSWAPATRSGSASPLRFFSTCTAGCPGAP